MEVLVVGGTGMAGSEVVNALLRRGVHVRVMTRYANKIKSLPPGARGCVGDLEKRTTLGACFDGADGVFLITPFSPNEGELGLAAVEAARAAAVKHIVYLSVPMPKGVNIPHFLNKQPIEQAIKSSGIAYTILRTNNFYQNDFLWCKAAVMAYGVYPQPIGSKGISRVDARDMAEAAANAFTEPGHAGQEYPINGPVPWTGPGVAAAFGRHLGRNVHYVGDDLETWSKQAQHMMPEWMVQYLRAMYNHYQVHGMIATAAEMEKQKKILHHPPRTFDAFITEIAPLWCK